MLIVIKRYRSVPIFIQRKKNSNTRQQKEKRGMKWWIEEAVVVRILSSDIHGYVFASWSFVGFSFCSKPKNRFHEREN